MKAKADDKGEGAGLVDEYIATFPAATRLLLEQMRKTIRECAPAASEKMAYRMPTFWLGENLVHFAGYAHHVGFYPTSSGTAAFEAELGKYKHSKGAIQFPLDEPLPLDLVRRVVRFRVEEAMARAAAKRGAKRRS